MPGFNKSEARRRTIPGFIAMIVVLVWALLYLTVPVIMTMQSGSFNWFMIIFVAAMWPLAGLIVVVVWRVAKERATAPAYECDRCQARWPRRESHKNS